ncbi:MAG: TonB family protein [Desulfatitalea sp.]|nr:TonB family protein [Desulfatitalea sp.]
MAYMDGDERHPLFWPSVISFVGHAIFFFLMIYTPDPDFEEPSFAPVISVQMVEMPASGPEAEKTADKSGEKAPVMEKPKPVEAKPAEETKAKEAQEAEVSIAPPQPKAKAALKYKTFKTQEVLKNAMERLEKKVDTEPPKALEDTIKRLREQVEKDGKAQSASDTVVEGTGAGKQGAYSPGGTQEGEVIDIYQLEIAYAINKNWAFSDQLAGNGDKLQVLIYFKVLPDGTIEDINYNDRSGNPYLDESAYKAIVKTSPVKPHPPGLNKPFIIMGLRFTPQGVQ